MKKRLYHGSQFIIPKPEYRKGKKEKADINELFILDIMREEISLKQKNREQPKNKGHDK